mgnify:CR=1 FL=1
MIELKNKKTGKVLGTISEEDFKFLQDHLVEESEEDTDYYLNRDELNVLKSNNASDKLTAILEIGFGDRNELEIEWEEVQ